MSDKLFEIKDDKLIIKLEVTPKGVKSIVLDLDEFELVETGTKTKDNKPTQYHKYKIIK